MDIIGVALLRRQKDNTDSFLCIVDNITFPASWSEITQKAYWEHIMGSTIVQFCNVASHIQPDFKIM